MRRSIIFMGMALVAGCGGNTPPQPATTVAVAQTPTITGVGHAIISSQPGRTIEQRRLMAIRASRLAAVRDLAEQIHGMRIDGRSAAVDGAIQSDSFRTQVDGLIVGARTVRIQPRGEDSYETILEVDRATIAALQSQSR